MVPIKAIRNGQVEDLRTGELYLDISQICDEHRLTHRALAFGLLLFNLKNPQIYKILDDKAYWTALDVTSGRYISLFYIKQEDNYFGQDLLESDGAERRGLHELKTGQDLLPIIKNHLKLDEKINYPAVLFFQVHEGLMTDYFLVSLDERNVEDSFWELQTYIQKAVNELESVKKENFGNSKEIFELLKFGVKNERLKRKIFKATQKFPVQLFLGWLTGKV
jgi:hypothetical protein